MSTTLAGFLLERIAEDEARVLAECASKRALIDRAQDRDWHGGGYAVRDVLLEILAQPYASHPAFDPSWTQ